MNKKQNSLKARVEDFCKIDPDTTKYLLYILLAAVVARVLYLIQFQDSVFYGNYILDSRIIDLWAKEIAFSDFWGSEAFFRAPLFPYIAALFYKLFGPSPLPVILFHNLLGILTAIVTFFYARYLLGKKPALIAGITTALWPTLIFFEGELMITTLGVFLAILSLVTLHLALDSGEPKRFIIAGIFLGLAAITRPTALVITLIIPIYYISSNYKDKFPRMLKLGLYYIVGLVIPILPVTIRNAAVAGEFVPISTQGGVNFYIGNSRYADGRSVVMPMQDVTYQVRNEDFVYAQSRMLAEKRLGRKLSDSEVSSYWFKEGLREISRNPVRAAALYLRKAAFFWHGQEIFNNKSPYIAGDYSVYMKLTIWKHVLNFPSGLLFPLMLAGVYAVINERRRFKVPLLYILLFSLAISVFFVCARFRQPIIPVVIILAVYGAYRLIQYVKKRDKAYLPMLLIFIVTLVMVNLGGDVESTKNKSQFENIQGTVYLKQKMFDEAIAHLKKSLEIAPDNRSAIGSLGYAYIMSGNISEAEKTFVNGIERFPRSSDLHFNLATLYYQMGYAREARPYFEKTIELDPRMPDGYMAMGMIFEQQQKPDSAVLMYETLLDHIPDYQPARAKLKELRETE